MIIIQALNKLNSPCFLVLMFYLLHLSKKQRKGPNVGRERSPELGVKGETLADIMHTST
jgi:hypothetical protein